MSNYTYNNITFTNIDLDTSYSNVGSKIKHHGITNDGIKDDISLSDYFILDSIFINWNNALLPSVNDITTYSYITCTADLLNYIVSLNKKINELSYKLDNIDTNTNYKIYVYTSHLNSTYDPLIDKTATYENPKEITFSAYDYYELPSSIEVSYCSYNYNKGLLNLYNPTDNVIVKANGTPIKYNFTYDNLGDNVKCELNAEYLTYESSNVTCTITSYNDYLIENATFSYCDATLVSNLNTNNAQYTLSKAKGTVKITPSIYKQYTIEKGTGENWTLNTNTINVYYGIDREYDITLSVPQDYELTSENITVDNASIVSYSDGILKIKNPTGTTITINCKPQLIQKSNEYVFMGIDIYNFVGNKTYTYMPNDTVFSYIISGNYLNNISGTEFNTDYQQLNKNWQSNLLTLSDDYSLNNEYYTFGNILFDITNLTSQIYISKNLIIKFEAVNKKVKNRYIAVPENYDNSYIYIEDDLKNSLINWTETPLAYFNYSYIKYNIYELNINSAGFQAHTYIDPNGNIKLNK